MAEAVRAAIRVAFPDTAFCGQVTPVDSEPDEDFDEEQALYGALHGKAWTEVPPSIVVSFADCLPLLTEAAFCRFLPAWLSCALDVRDVSEMVIYGFSRVRGVDDTSFLDIRLQALSGPQREAIRSFLAYACDAERSKFVQDHARRALNYVRTFD